MHMANAVNYSIWRTRLSISAIFASIKSLVLNILNKCIAVIGVASCCLLAPVINAQTPSFFHLTTANGLADNNIRSLVIDKKGFLWIGTIEGLSMFDGYRVTSFYKDKQPLLVSNNIVHLT